MTPLSVEMAAAGRGMLALLTGRRNASSYFDLTTRGLVGSCAAFLLATGVSAYLPRLLQQPGAEGLAAWQAFFAALFFYVLQIGFSAIVLKQIGRMDGLMPYVVADNWASFFVTGVTIALTFAGMTSETALLLLAIPVIIVEINIARLIVTLSALQIVSFLIAQFVGVVLGILALGMILPGPVV